MKSNIGSWYFEVVFTKKVCLFWRFFQKYHACGYHGSGDKVLSEPILRPKKACSARQAHQVNLASLKPLLPMLDSHSNFEQILESSLFIYFVFWGGDRCFFLWWDIWGQRWILWHQESIKDIGIQLPIVLIHM